MNSLGTVMIVDDDLTSNLVNKRLIEKEDITDQIISYTHPKEALEYLEMACKTEDCEFPELIIVDIMMPDINGHEFIKSVQQLELYDVEKNKIVYLTSSMKMDDLMSADEANIELYLLKPLTSEKIRDVINVYFH